MRMSVELANGKMVEATFDTTVSGYQAGQEFKKAVLLQAAQQMTTPKWHTVKAVLDEA